MDLARELLFAGEPAPLLVTADEQTAGRGRQGRLWVAPAGSALLLSLGLRPTWLRPERSPALVWMAGVALCEAVARVTPLRPALKWPNDLLLPVAGGYAKGAGILLELGLGAEQVDWAIIGCGVNVSAAPPPELTRYPAASLSAAAGAPVSRLALLRALLERLDEWHGRLAGGGEADLFAAWRAHLHTIGQAVSITTDQGVVAGVAEAVDRSGALLVRRPSGELTAVTSGDVGLA